MLTVHVSKQDKYKSQEPRTVIPNLVVSMSLFYQLGHANRHKEPHILFLGFQKRNRKTQRKHSAVS